MSPHKRIIWICIPLIVLGLCIGCSDDPTEPDGNGVPHGDVTTADSMATHWMQALADSLEIIPDNEDADSYRAVRYTEIRDGMDAALEVNSDSPIAHIGCALLDIIEVNYDPELWEVIDSLIAYDDENKSALASTGGIYFRPGSPILRNQFTLLATAPRELARRTLTGIPGNLTLARAQEILEELVMPAFDSAIQHLAAAEENAEPVINLQLEDEIYEIDLGDILMFDAALHAARAGICIAISYELDLFDRAGGYGWIDEINDLDLCESFGYSEPYGAGSRRVVHVWSERNDAARDSLAISVLQYNLEERFGFLSLRDNRMSVAYDNLLTLRDKLEEAVAAIRAETDNQNDDIIKIVDLTDLDDEIDDAGNKPRFAESFTTIEDVLNWVETVLTGTYHIDEEADYGDIEIDVNLSMLFTNAPNNWKEYIPYYRFKDPQDWLDWHWYAYGWDVSPRTECFSTCEGPDSCLANVTRIEYLNGEYDLDFIELLDGPNGDPIDLNEVIIPYVPDYSFGGLFPGATRDTWLDIAEAAGW
ncbi:MAG: hypothetical protein KJ970_20835 [Candidatus Eisenbacteria bacterium]|uniref:Uncharacterized protein n=1 Tax=Eiseniibacteriota bacterium TaxID=2212470 RepID=A0A948S101_UNCEI|nr:hypothetical protein [Candidatus Eisenbacteria bacterium]MBU1947178.1 hypothetical protein [Candidatus Eisenbacteria bacterium]MBU2693373.1 hypothetical protein [Candidatus Eisenbacteria bacterium]